MKKFSKAIAASSVAFLPFLALADVRIDKNWILTFITNTTSWFRLIISALAILVILYAAFLFLTAGGNEEKVGSAKQTLIYGLIGIGVALVAYGIEVFVESFLV